MSGYIGNIPTPQATQTRDVFTATAGQTSFATSGYTPGFLDVYLNGVHLVNGTDYTASNGSDVVLSSGAATSDIVEVLSYSTYEVNNQAFTGDFSVDGTTFKVDSTNDLVGIGNGSPISYYNGARNLVVGTTSGNNGITVVSGSTGVGRLFFADGTSGADLYRGYVEYLHNSNSLIFGTDGTTRMVVDAGGRITTDYQPMFCGRQYLSDGSIVASGFPAFRWATIELNQGNHFNNVTGIFTTPVAGKYEVRFHFNRRAANNWHAAYIFINGVARINGWFPPGPDSNYTYAPLSVGGILSLAASDQISFAYSSTYSAPSSDTLGNTASIALIG